MPNLLFEIFSIALQPYPFFKGNHFTILPFTSIRYQTVYIHRISQGRDLLQRKRSAYAVWTDPYHFDH